MESWNGIFAAAVKEWRRLEWQISSNCLFLSLMQCWHRYFAPLSIQTPGIDNSTVLKFLCNTCEWMLNVPQQNPKYIFIFIFLCIRFDALLSQSAWSWSFQRWYTFVYAIWYWTCIVFLCDLDQRERERESLLIRKFWVVTEEIVKTSDVLIWDLALYMLPRIVAIGLISWLMKIL